MELGEHGESGPVWCFNLQCQVQAQEINNTAYSYVQLRLVVKIEIDRVVRTFNFCVPDLPFPRLADNCAVNKSTLYKPTPYYFIHKPTGDS